MLFEIIIIFTQKIMILISNNFIKSKEKINDEILTKEFIQKMIYKNACNLHYLKASKLIHRNLSTLKMLLLLFSLNH